MPSNKKYNIAEAAKELNVTRQTVHAAIQQKRLKAKRGTFMVERIVRTKMKGWVIDENDLRAFEVSQQHQEAGKKNE
jgi:DNA-directed RNA polymerase specialized sigma54-like protein